MTFRKDINGLRAIAVLSVLAFHFGIPSFNGGFIGVDVFFVISGYLMTSIILRDHEKNCFSLLGFYAARARRIIPALLGLCLALLIFGWFLLPPTQYLQIATSIFSALGFYSNISLWLEAGYFDSASLGKWLLHTWSLSVEWQFYLLYPIFVAWLLNVSRPIVLKWTLLGMMMMSFIACIYVTQRNPAPAFYFLPTRGWEMLAGGLAFIQSQSFKPKGNTRTILEFAGLLIILFCIILFKADTLWPGYYASLPVLGAYLIILANNNNSIATTNVFMQSIGKWSYSIYIWHWPIVVALNYAGKLNDPIWITIGLASSIVLGIASYHYIEQKGKSITFKPFSTTAKYFVASLAVVLTSALFIILGNGIPQRSYGDATLTAKYELASQEKPHSLTSICKLPYSKKNIMLCHIGTQETDRILLIGDSHAIQYFYKYSGSENLSRGASMLAHDGCPPLPNVALIAGKGHCTLFFDKAMEHARDARYSRIVLASVWVEYLNGNICWSKNNTCSGSNKISPSQLDDVFKRMSDDLKSLTTLNKEVYIVLPLPRSEKNTPKELERREFYNQSKDDLLFISMASHKKRTAQIEMRLRELARTSGANIIDPTLTMCTENNCPVLDEAGRPIYFDNNHIRGSYVKEHTEFLNFLMLPNQMKK